MKFGDEDVYTKERVDFSDWDMGDQNPSTRGTKSDRYSTSDGKGAYDTMTETVNYEPGTKGDGGEFDTYWDGD